MAATVEVSLAFIGELLFGATDHPVEVIGVVGGYADEGAVLLVIDGPDLPADAEHVEAIVSEERNRAGDRLRRITFRKAHLQAELKTADEWLATPEFNHVRMLDPDGWDRSDFERSWAERITKTEFQRRLMLSSIQCLPRRA